MEPLHCIAQTYAWGKLGQDSTVARLKGSSDRAFQVDAATPYAELWMGTHPSGPSHILRNGAPAELLSEWLKANEAETETVTDAGELPFLFKVLSVGQALSIQAHPDLERAKTLHARFPTVYKDPNHKPEMAIALTQFEALCQFRPLEELAANLQAVPELRQLAGDAAVDALVSQQDSSALREFFTRYINASESAIAAQTASIRDRLQQLAPESRTSVDALVLRLIEQYGNDIGVFCPYLLNYITLEPGQAVFLDANEPHAYLAGDCIECMACSDNVVRAGLTPKFIDKATLCEMLTYKAGLPEILTGDQEDDTTRVYASPVPEFQVEALEIPRASRVTIPTRSGPSILLLIRGSGDATLDDEDETVQLVEGGVFLIGANQVVTIESKADTDIQAFRAFPNEQRL